MYSYPKDLVATVRERWDSGALHDKGTKRVAPAEDVLHALFDTAFQASMLLEEGRRLSFRLALLSRAEVLSLGKGHTPGAVALAPDRPLTVAELLRLAPAADFQRSLICVEPSDGAETDLRIWGLLEIGSSWWKFASGQATHGRMPPDCIVVTVDRPGGLSVSRVGQEIASLRAGAIAVSKLAPLRIGPIADFFRLARNEFHEAVLKRIEKESWGDGADANYPTRYFTSLLERLVFYVLQRRHGGAILFVPNALTLQDTRLTDRVAIKYPAEDTRVWGAAIDYLAAHDKFYGLHFPLWHGKQELSIENFRRHSVSSSALDEAHERVDDLLQFLASLTAVDGALVLTDRLRLVGFGAEIVVPSPTLSKVRVADHNKGLEGSYRAMSEYGTRHRSAFRICSSLEEAVMVVISQDGGAKAIRRVGAEVVMWPEMRLGMQ